MKLIDLVRKKNSSKNMDKARRIRAVARSDAKEDNPEETDPIIGWNADPHAGGTGFLFRKETSS